MIESFASINTFTILPINHYANNKCCGLPNSDKSFFFRFLSEYHNFISLFCFGPGMSNINNVINYVVSVIHRAINLENILCPLKS